MDAAEYALMDLVEEEMWWYRALHSRLLAALAPVSGRVLDAGCGTGGFLRKLAAARPDLELVGLEWDGAAAVRAGSNRSGRSCTCGPTTAPAAPSSGTSCSRVAPGTPGALTTATR